LHYILINHPRKKEKKRKTPKNNKSSILLKRKTPNYTFYNKKDILICGDIEKNPGPKFTLLLN
jgi:hypothetical protein